MAIVGQQLTTPENGWTRYDQTNPLIEFSYTTTHSSSNLYGGTQSQTNIPNSYYRFGFFGTGFRIIEAFGPNRNRNIQVKIDNKNIETYNAYDSSDKFQYLMYEKVNLPYRYHTVEVRKIDSDTTTYLSVDAIDITSDGYLTTYDLGKLKKALLSLKNPSTNQHYSLAEKTLIPLPDSSPKNMILHGIEVGEEVHLDEAFDKINYPVEGVLKSTAKTMVKPLSIKFE